AGSATCLADCFRHAVSFGVPLESALRAATINPARCAGLLDTLGSITEGKRADVLVLNKDLAAEHIFIGGVQTK
ncbi:MAG: amidohydrolase family protein, partial [Ruthenibacterium sp.]